MRNQTFFTYPGTLSTTFALIEQFRTTNMAGFINFDRVNIRRRKRENSFYTYSI